MSNFIWMGDKMDYLIWAIIYLTDAVGVSTFLFHTQHVIKSKISDFEKFKLQYTNPSSFRARNVYFDLQGIEMI